MAIIQKAAYFPEILPGEIVYSVLARLRRHTGSPPAFADRFYGSKITAHTLNLPARIAALAAKIPDGRGFDAKRIVRDHTLFNYYARFSAPKAREAALHGMLGENGMAHKRLSLALSFPFPTAVRFCPECLSTMMAEHGEYYWRREHQLPSVLVCPSHGCDLRSSTAITASSGHTLNKLIAATKATCPADAPSVLPLVSSAVRRKLHEIATDCVAILEERDGFEATGQDVTHSYCALLARKGLADSIGRVQAEEYAKIVEPELIQLQPIWPFLFRNDGRCGRWLGRLSCGSTSQDTTFVMLAFGIAQALPDVEPVKDTGTIHFGLGPWLCRNPLADHFGEATICDPVFNTLYGHVTARFQCSCGYIYTQKHRSDGSKDKPRLYRFGETLRPILLHAMTSRWTPTWTARLVGISTGTLIAEARRMGVATPWVEGRLRKRRGDVVSPDPKGSHAEEVRRMFIRAPIGAEYGVPPGNGKSSRSPHGKRSETARGKSRVG